MISGTTVRNKRHGAGDSSGQDPMGGYTRWPEAYLHFDRQMLFPLCFWSTRDHS